MSLTYVCPLLFSIENDKSVDMCFSSVVFHIIEFTLSSNIPVSYQKKGGRR